MASDSLGLGDGNKTLTFTIRDGVEWTDGTPMTAADVAFTFNLMKKFPGLDLNSLWSVLSSVTQQGNQVSMTFKSAAVPYFYTSRTRPRSSRAHLVHDRQPGELRRR